MSGNGSGRGKRVSGGIEKKGGYPSGQPETPKPPKPPSGAGAGGRPTENKNGTR